MTINPKGINKKPTFNKPDVISLSNHYNIKGIELLSIEKGNKAYHLNIIPTFTYKGLDKWGESNSKLDSNIWFLNQTEYEAIFGDTNPTDINGKLIELSFAVPGRWNNISYSCRDAKIERFERMEIYSPDFECSQEPVTIVSIVPNCRIIHIAPSSYGHAHYNLKMLFDSHKFKELKSFFDIQRGEFSDQTFPKQKLPLELRLFKILD